MVEFAQATVPAGSGTVKTVQHGGDDNLFVEFYRNAADGKDHIKMRIPGDKTFAPDYVADERYQRRFPRQWEAYKNQTDQFAGETRLEEVVWINEGTRHNLHSFGIFTIEGLSRVIDGNLKNIGPGAREMRERAISEIDEKRKVAAFDEAQADKAEMMAEMASMREEMKKLRAENAPKRRGRPPKNQEEYDAA